jgi:hypothetical protein
LDARTAFSDLDGYRDSGERAAALDAAIAPLEARTEAAGDLVASGRSAAAIVELREIVTELPDLREAVQLLEQARRDLVDDAVTASDRLISAGDVAGARDTLVDASCSSRRARRSGSAWRRSTRATRCSCLPTPAT